MTYGQAYFSTKQSASSQDARFPSADGYQEWQIGPQAKARQRSQATNTLPLLRSSLVMKTNLRDSRDFQKVYRTGKRYDSSLMTAFALPNRCSYHRLGVTASRKALGNAVQRNRAKRMLRETFRLTKIPLNGLQRKYDWVLNGRRRLLSAMVSKPLDEFQTIIGAVASDESDEIVSLVNE